jgi:DNA-binding NarL/FixJ family response regulator
VRTRILLADDHDVVRRGVRELLEAREEWTVCGEASDGREAVHMVAKLAPDLAVLDISMPGLNGLEATRMIRRGCPATDVIIFTLHEEERLIRDALLAGARGIVSKADGGGQIVLAVEALSRHKPFFSPNASQILLDEYECASRSPHSAAARAGGLTPRERDVVRLLANGCGNREVGAALGLSAKTVETHRASVMRKLRLHSIVELVRYAIRNGLAEV